MGTRSCRLNSIEIVVMLGRPYTAVPQRQKQVQNRFIRRGICANGLPRSFYFEMSSEMRSLMI